MIALAGLPEALQRSSGGDGWLFRPSGVLRGGGEERAADGRGVFFFFFFFFFSGMFFAFFWWIPKLESQLLGVFTPLSA